jgi:hypothetical protein
MPDLPEAVLFGQMEFPVAPDVGASAVEDQRRVVTAPAGGFSNDGAPNHSETSLSRCRGQRLMPWAGRWFGIGVTW